jgi:hydrogenase nickel incorporation protein HypA/HybF
MHELTLLFGVAAQVEKVTKENGIDHVDAVVLEVGELTPIVPEFLIDGYEVISDEYDFLRGSKLIVNRITGMVKCRDCGKEYPVAKYEGYCPVCGSYDKDILCGEEFIIKEIRILESPDDSGEANSDNSAVVES